MSTQDSRTNWEIAKDLQDIILKYSFHTQDCNLVSACIEIALKTGCTCGFQECLHVGKKIIEALDSKSSKISELEAKVVELTPHAENWLKLVNDTDVLSAIANRDLKISEQSILLQELARALKNRYHDGKCLNCGYPIFNCVPTCEWEVALTKLNKFQKEER